MGMFDTIVLDAVPSMGLSQVEAQVKLWDRKLHAYHIGDEVPRLDFVDSPTTYSIALREGGFVNIKERFIESYSSSPTYHHVFDKWGGKEFYG